MSQNVRKSTQTILGQRRGRRVVQSTVVKNDNITPPARHQPRPLPTAPTSSAPLHSANPPGLTQSSPEYHLDFASSEPDYTLDLNDFRDSSPDPDPDPIIHHPVKRVRVSIILSVGIIF